MQVVWEKTVSQTLLFKLWLHLKHTSLAFVLHSNFKHHIFWRMPSWAKQTWNVTEPVTSRIFEVGIKKHVWFNDVFFRKLELICNLLLMEPAPPDINSFMFFSMNSINGKNNASKRRWCLAHKLQQNSDSIWMEPLKKMHQKLTTQSHQEVLQARKWGLCIWYIFTLVFPIVSFKQDFPVFFLTKA